MTDFCQLHVWAIAGCVKEHVFLTRLTPATRQVWSVFHIVVLVACVVDSSHSCLVLPPLSTVSQCSSVPLQFERRWGGGWGVWGWAGRRWGVYVLYCIVLYVCVVDGCVVRCCVCVVVCLCVWL
jgi:hypothetical protein